MSPDECVFHYHQVALGDLKKHGPEKVFYVGLKVLGYPPMLAHTGVEWARVRTELESRYPE